MDIETNIEKGLNIIKHFFRLGSISDGTPELDLMMKYKMIYYCTNVSYKDIVEYVAHFGYKKTKVIKLLNYYIKNGYIAEADIRAKLNILTVKDLKQILRDNGLPLSGRKADLILRLTSNLSETSLSQYVPKLKRKHLMRTEKGDELYKQLFEQRNIRKEELAAEVADLVRQHRFSDAQTVSHRRILLDFPSSCSASKYDNKYLKRIMEELGEIQGCEILADAFCQKRTINTSTFYTLYEIYKCEDEGVLSYEVCSDSSCCEICAKYRNRRFPIANAKVGVNAPPFHIGCRCCILIPDDDD